MGKTKISRMERLGRKLDEMFDELRSGKADFVVARELVNNAGKQIKAAMTQLEQDIAKEKYPKMQTVESLERKFEE